MEPSTGGALIGILVGGGIGLIISLAIGSGFLNLACKIVRDRAPGFLKGVLLVFLGGLIYMAIAVVLGLVMGGGLGAFAGQMPADQAEGPGMQAALPGIVTMALSFVINAFLFKALVPLGSVGKGFLVSLIYTILWTILLVICAVAMAGVVAALISGG